MLQSPGAICSSVPGRAGGRVAEQPGDPPLAGDLADDRAPARARGEQRERGGDGRLADAALARHDDEPVIEQWGVVLHGRADYGTGYVSEAAEETVGEAYRACARMQRRRDPTYYWAVRCLPAERRPAFHALYGFVRGADDIADDVRPQRRAPRRARRLAGRARARPRARATASTR